MKIGIGIDTGGTYTDAVLYDFDARSILGTAKSLTTKQDLAIGILGAIDGLPAELLPRAEFISLSTTLATNACVEDKGGRAKLIFFGGDKRVIDEVGGKYGLPCSDDMHVQESFTTFSGESTAEPDWAAFTEHLARSNYEQLDGIGIIEINAMRNGAVIEKQVKQVFERIHNIPAVCGHELFSELNCLQRASSTLLNAGLFPVIKEFLTAVKKALAARGVNAPLLIVRSDGSMMSEAFAALRPVETLLCGPAASAIGGTQLTDSPNSIIVDMGGTTTDIAIVKNGVPVTVVDGVSIGKWKTFVDGLYVKTFGLGGDSAIHYKGSNLYLEDYRITPLCIAAQKHPAVLESLRDLPLKKHTCFLYEHYMLVKDIEQSVRYTDAEKAFCRALADKPLILTQAAQAVGRDIYSLNVQRLIKDGVVQICGLTPTDIMHIKGDFDGYCTQASHLAVAFAAHNLGVSPEVFCDMAYDEVKRKMHLNIVKALLENKDPHYIRHGVSADIERLIDEHYRSAKSGSHDALLSMPLTTDYALVGIGAPIHVFLPDVAQALGTHAVLPEHHAVANALGAIMGSVSASCTVKIMPSNDAAGIIGYTVFGVDGNQNFELLDEAVAHARAQAEIGAQREAVKRGASGALTVTCDVSQKQAQAKDSTVYLGTTVTARAVGVSGFGPATAAPVQASADQAPAAKKAITEQPKHAYPTRQLVQQALAAGFSQAGELSTKALVFMPEVKDMCKSCHQYNTNWRCPPACGSVEDTARQVAQYSYGILVQTVGHMQDEFDHETIQSTSQKHSRNFTALVEDLRQTYPDVLPMGAGTCSLCPTCSYPDAPCRFPDKAISAMEAYGLWVSRVCALSGMPYNNGKRTVTYTSCYLLK